MWNLSGDDIQRAKAELTGRRAAIQAKYDTEIKQLAADLAALETFERAAVSFVSNYKGQDVSPATDAGPAPAAETTGPTSQATPVAQSAAAEPDPVPAAGEKSSSRWRMRLGAGDAGPQSGDEPA